MCCVLNDINLTDSEKCLHDAIVDELLNGTMSWYLRNNTIRLLNRNYKSKYDRQESLYQFIGEVSGLFLHKCPSRSVCRCVFITLERELEGATVD